MERIKEKPPVRVSMREKGKAAPKELARQALQHAIGQTRQQLREAAQEGEIRDDYGTDAALDQITDTAWQSSGQLGQIVRHRLDLKRPDIKTKASYMSGQPDTPTELIQAEAAPSERMRQAAIDQLKNNLELRSDSNPPLDFSEPSQIPLHSRSTAERPSAPPRNTESVHPPAKIPRQSIHSEQPIVPLKKSTQPGKQLPKSKPQAVKQAGYLPKTAPQTSTGVLLSKKRAARAAVRNTQRSLQTAKVTAWSATVTLRAAARVSLQAIRAALASTKALIAALAAGGWVAVAVILVVVLFGSALTFLGGENAGAALPVSAEVEAYEPLLRQYANQYGIPEYVELLKAIMMQESGGRGTDPMQASESGYNTRYPRTPGSITDPVYSIQCGVQAVRDVLERAGVTSPLDMEHIKLALQGYNFGPGYISWAVRHYGGYSLANAEEFSAMMAEQMGWSRYGDTQYVPHVLRYYIFGRIGTGIGNEALVAIALSQVGNGGTTYWSWYGFDSRVEWCACFVSWCADQCGLIDAATVPKFSLCSDGAAWFAARGRLMDASAVPSPGDIVFFDWGNNGTIDHVGIVERVEEGMVYTVEGNSGDQVRQRSYRLESASIYGYGVHEQTNYLYFLSKSIKLLYSSSKISFYPWSTLKHTF